MTYSDYISPLLGSTNKILICFVLGQCQVVSCIKGHENTKNVCLIFVYALWICWGRDDGRGTVL